MDQKNEMFMQQTTCSRWGIFEVGVDGPKDGNPFIEQKVTGIFKGDNETVSCDGFYDGDGVYRIRFMPSFEGAYTYQIQTTFGGDCTGNFTVTAPKENAHGPVRVDGFLFLCMAVPFFRLHILRSRLEDGLVYRRILGFREERR